MALGAVLAAALTNHGTRAYGLWIDGLDVISEPATTRRYGVDISTVRVTLNGPGSVSTMSFTIDDPQSLVTVTDGQVVRFHSFVGGTWPMFYGWVERYRVQPDFGQNGRSIIVDCIGAEVLLDWYVTTYDLSFTTTTFLYTMIQSIIAAAPGIGEIRAFSDPVNGQGSTALPIGQMGNAFNVDFSGTVPVTILAGTTIREAINQAAAACTGTGTFLGCNFTVDMQLGMRAWEDKTPPNSPLTDYASSFAVDATTGGVVAVPSNLTYDVDASGIVRTVVVKGTGVTVTVNDGSGKRGPTRVLNDTTITTVAAASAAGMAYLADYRAGLRGTVGLENSQYGDEGAEGVLKRVTIFDNATGQQGTYKVTSLDLTFHKDYHDIVLSFGGQPPSGAALIRRLTRGTLS